MVKAGFNLPDIRENLAHFLLNIKIKKREKSDIKGTLNFQLSFNFIPMDINFRK